MATRLSFDVRGTLAAAILVRHLFFFTLPLTSSVRCPARPRSCRFRAAASRAGAFQ